MSARAITRSSTQAAIVTMTSTSSDQNEPSLSLGDRDDALGIGEPHARGYPGLAGARPKPDADDIRLRILFVEDVNGPDEIVGRHRALDRTVIGTALPFSTIGGNSSDLALAYLSVAQTR